MMSIFLFHRDLRYIDNTSLIKLSEVSKDIIPIFVFTPEQILNNKYKNDRSIQFMIECIENNLKGVNIFYGDLIDVLEDIFKKYEISHLGFNLDYTPYAMKRTQRVKKLCKQYNVEVVAYEDYNLVEMDDVRKGGMYSVFKPYYERVMKMDIRKPSSKKIILSKKKITSKKVDYHKFFEKNNDSLVEGNRNEGLKILRNIKIFSKYEKERNDPSKNTTLLSAHIKFGTVSVREVYYAFKGNRELVKQLVWKDFYSQLMHYLDEERTIGGGNFKNKKIKWENNKRLFDAWCEGKTGFPIVDAGMRQLNKTGWMHNRVRLITANFLPLILGIDWRKGEKYFAQKLVDYDISSNNGNWQWTAQVGTDRTPFLRIYNPFNNPEKDCVYIKKWVDELKNVKESDINNWDKKHLLYDIDYHPIVDYNERYRYAKKNY